MTSNKALLALALGLALAATTAKSDPTSHNYTKEFVNIDNIAQLVVVEDFKHHNVCYITPYGNAASTSCVPMHP